MRSVAVTHKIMSSIHSKNTRPEIALRRELFSRGLRYRINYKKLKGKPDIVFTKAHLVVFVDGDFWHGNNWRLRRYKDHEDEMQHYSKFWRDKIERNMERDQSITKELTKDGWIVLRIWESDIKKDLSRCADTVETWYKLLTSNK